MAKFATTNIFFDSYHPKSDNRCAVTIRVTFDRKKRYYPTKYKLTPEEFDNVISDKPSKTNKIIKIVLSDQESKAVQIINELKDRFTWTIFEQRFITKTGDNENAFALLLERSKLLRLEGRIGTAVSFECTLSSLKRFHSREKLTFDEINVAFLKKYKCWMLESQLNSNATVGIYLRNVRTIFNEAISTKAIPKELYPFGKGNDKFVIPTGRNIKKAISPLDLEKIFKYEPINSSEEKALDFWKFSYLGSGINVKDIALLKIKNIDGDYINFIRAKTQNKNEDKPVVIKFYQTADIKSIIKKWGTQSLEKNNYVFQILSVNDTPEEVYKKVALFVAFMNANMKKIIKKLEIKSNCTTYVARHSFASFLKGIGKTDEYIGEAIGHGDIKSTRNYLASFGDDVIKRRGEELTNFNNKIEI